MKAKVIVFILIICGSLNVFSKDTGKEPGLRFDPEKPVVRSGKRTINNLDSVIFDLANATITATYVDLPIYAKSDDIITGMDYAIKFNLAKLTFSTTIDLLPNDPTVVSLGYFNPSTFFLKYIGTTQQTFPANGSTYITKIRFALSAPCVPLDTSDFNNIATYLNGDACGYRVTYLNFAQFTPNANFSNSPPCLNANIQFTDASTITIGNITSWSWNLGNGATSTQQNPSTTYTTTGVFTSSLIVTSSLGCKDTLVTQLTVNEVPVSSFTHSFDCLKDSVFFTNTSSIPSGAIISSLWDFGDSGGSILTSPSHHYNASGFYTVTLVSTSNFSCTATASVAVNLNNKVSASFTTTSINNCLGSVISFSDASTYPLTPITAWSWNFGDGTTSTQQNPTHTYTTSGTFSVTLTSTGTDGCQGNITKIITISPPPVVQFAASSATNCAFAAVTFSDQSTAAAGSTYMWNFGDGNTSNLQNPAHSYSTAGAYSVKLIVITPGGCSDSLIKTSYLTIIPSPVAGFSLSSFCILANVSFINNTTLSTGSIVAWLWNFGDGNTSTLQSPGNTYTVAGSYTVSLSATSNLGCAGTATQAVVLTSKPTVDFTFIDGTVNCSGQMVNFTNLSTPATGPSYLWSFGDGGTAVLQNPAHTYSSSGSYPIKLVVTNPGGCADSLTKSYTVTLPLPATPLFSDTILSNAVVLFSNLSLNAVNVSWNFGDNQTSPIDNPTHTFPDAATYQVCLTAYNSLNCPAMLCKDIYVGLASIVAIPSSFTPNQDNINDVLKVRGGPFIEMDFKIFNEWGNLLFSSPSQNVGWDGSFNGEAQPVGVYEYVLKGKTIEKKNINLYGIVNLTR